MTRARILSVGKYLPERRVTNFDLEKMFETSDAWIQQRTGIVERRYADEGVYCSDLALEASRDCLKNAGMKPEDIDFIIFATLSPDHFFPGNGVYLQKKLGVIDIGCMDIRNQCSGFVYSLAVADAFIRIGMYKRILVVGAEIHSGALNYTFEGRDVAVLFGDAAAAVIVVPSDDPSRGILSSHLHADGRFADILKLELLDISKKPYITHKSLDEGLQYPKMKGKEVFKVAVERIPAVIREALQANNLKVEDVDLFLAHQANLRINQFAAERLGVSQDKFYNNIQRYGNTTAASIPLLLDEVLERGILKEGQLVVMVAFGSGFTWGASVMRW
ncbi:MAG TPA: beta-ketoacyl-ACP synthase III [Dehalococcoidia bacterium]|nr:beta-ketoacyl-ACP synthase III [Dehalococcoidia bacterium]